MPIFLPLCVTPITCCIILLQSICLCTSVNPSWCICGRLMHRDGMWSCVSFWKQEVTLWLSLRQWRGRTCWWQWTEAKLLLWARRLSVISCWSYRWLNILEYAWLCLQFIDLNHHPSADTRSQNLASLWQFCHQRFQKFILWMTMYVTADALKSTRSTSFWYVLNCITWACSDPRRCAGSVTVLEGIYNIIWSICVVMWHTSYIVWSFGQNVCLRWNEYSLS